MNDSWKCMLQISIPVHLFVYDYKNKTFETVLYMLMNIIVDANVIFASTYMYYQFLIIYIRGSHITHNIYRYLSMLCDMKVIDWM